MGGGYLDIFSLVYHFSPFSLSLGDGPIWTEILSQRAVKPKTTNQPTLFYLFIQKVERENKTVEQTSKTGGWCIHDAKELGSGGFHATDLKLAPALAKFFKGMQ